MTNTTHLAAAPAADQNPPADQGRPSSIGRPRQVALFGELERKADEAGFKTSRPKPGELTLMVQHPEVATLSQLVTVADTPAGPQWAWVWPGERGIAGQPDGPDVVEPFGTVLFVDYALRMLQRVLAVTNS